MYHPAVYTTSSTIQVHTISSITVISHYTKNCKKIVQTFQVVNTGNDQLVVFRINLEKFTYRARMLIILIC